MRSTARRDAEHRPACAPFSAWGVALIALLMLATNGVVQGKPCPGEHCVRVRPQDEVLLVNTRRLGCSTDQDRFDDEITAARYEPTDANGDRTWRPIPLAELVASVEPTTPTILFSHGNRVEPCEVTSRGLWVYSRLTRCGRDERPIRFVIFSWPSSQIKGLIRDAREKAARTRPAGFHLAWVANQFSPSAPLGLFGYSYGARVISGATHILGGGSLGGLALPGRESLPKRPIQAVYLAAAFDADWLGPGRYHGHSLQQVDALLTATNQRDPAMKFYRLFSPRHETALGYAGPTCLPREASPRVRLMNLTSQVGGTHDMCEYMAVDGFMASAWRRLTFADAPPPQLAAANSSNR